MTWTAQNDGYKLVAPNGKFVDGLPVFGVLINPTTGGALGTAASPLVTQTSSLQTTLDLTPTLITINTATTTTLVSAAASTSIRIYRMEVDCAAADVLTFNALVNRVQTYGGIGHIIQDFATRPWFTCAVNTPFTVTTTTTALANITVEWTRVA